jgi:hypothetical protein
MVNKPEYLCFKDSPLPHPGRKTRVIDIYSVSSSKRLGQIRWYSRWRQYTFFPDVLTIWNGECLDQIQDRLKMLNKEHRELLRLEHAQSN